MGSPLKCILIFEYRELIISFCQVVDNAMYISSVESQKGIIAVQRCFVENQKGTIAVQSIYGNNALLALN